MQALHNAHVVGEFLFVVGSLHTVDVALEEFVNIGRVAARLAEVVLEFAFALRHGHTHFVAEGVDVGLEVGFGLSVVAACEACGGYDGCENYLFIILLCVCFCG